MVTALHFFLTITLDRPDLSRKLIRIHYRRELPTVLNPEEVCWRMVPSLQTGIGESCVRTVRQVCGQNSLAD
jgi:hypothetical protein